MKLSYYVMFMLFCQNLFAQTVVESNLRDTVYDIEVTIKLEEKVKCIDTMYVYLCEMSLQSQKVMNLPSNLFVTSWMAI
jgi:subtilase family serine protease